MRRATSNPSNFSAEVQKAKKTAMDSKGDPIQALAKALKTSDLLNLEPSGNDRKQWSVETETSVGFKSMKFFIRMAGDLLHVELVQKSRETPRETLIEINVEKFLKSSL